MLFISAIELNTIFKFYIFKHERIICERNKINIKCLLHKII